MRLRAGHVTIGVIVVVTAFVVVAVWRGASGPGSREVVEGMLPPLGAADEVPSLAVDTTEVDLGVIPHDGEGHGKLVVHNRGRGPLNITEVRSSCACTAGAFAQEAMPIPPGASADLNIKVFPTRIYGFESRKTLTLYSNDPARPSLEVVVSARIDPEFSLEPDKFDFGAVAKGSSAAREIRLRTLIDTPMKVTGFTAVQPESGDQPPSGLSLECIPVPEGEWKAPGHAEYVLRATVGPELPQGRFDFGAFVATDLKRFRFLRVPVHGTVEAPYTVEMPSTLRLVVIQPSAADARVKVTSGVPVVLESAVAAGGTVAVSSRAVEGGIELVFVPAPGLAAGRHDDKVRVGLRVGDKTFEELFEVRAFAGAAAKPEQ